MPITMHGNTVTGRYNSPLCFNVGGNRINGFEIGDADPNKCKHHLLAYIIYASEKFIFNGRLFLKDGRQGVIFDNFPVGPAPNGWEKVIRPDKDEYDLVDKASGVTIFGFRVAGNECVVTVDLYNERGECIAKSDGRQFFVSDMAKLGGNYFDRLGNPAV